MKIEATVKAVSDALKLAGRACPGSAALPVLGYVLIEATEAGLQLVCTNLDQTMAVTCEAVRIDGDGSVCLPLNRLLAILATQYGEFALEVDDKALATLRTKTANYTLQGHAADEFPARPAFEGKAAAVRESDLLGVLTRVAPAMSTDAKRYVLNGVLIECQKRAVNVVATDGRRLHVEPLKGVQFGAVRAIVPGPAVRQLCRALASSDEDVRIEIADGWASFAGAEWTLTTKLIEGTYPNWRQVVPSPDEQAVKATVECYGLSSMLKQALAICPGDTPYGTVDVNGTVTVAASAPDIGTAAVHMGSDNDGAEKSRFSVNLAYMLEAIAHLDFDEVHLATQPDGLSPVLLGGLGFLAVIMPVRGE